MDSTQVPGTPPTVRQGRHRGPVEPEVLSRRAARSGQLPPTAPPTTRRQARAVAPPPAPTTRRQARPPKRRLSGPKVAAATSAAVLLASLGGAAASAQGVTSGSFVLNPGMSRTADSGERITDGTGSAVFTVPGRPTGGGVYLMVEVRAGGAQPGYRGKARVLADGSLRVGLSRLIAGTEENIGSVPVPGRVDGGERVHVQTSVVGNGKVKLAARAWLEGAARPGWQYVTTETTSLAATTIGEGAVRASGYLSRGATAPMTLTFSDLAADRISGPGGTPTGTPTTATTTVPPTSSTGTSSTSTEPTRTTTRTSTSSTTTTTKPTATKPAGGKPGAGNTGVPAGTSLTRHDGNMVITKAGTVVDGLDIHGFVDVKAPNVTIKRSIVRGGVATYNRGLVTNTTASATGFVIEDSTLIPAHPSVYLDGLKGANFTGRRLDISGGVDAVKVHGNNARVEASWLHGMARYAADPAQRGGPTHNDGVQVLGGTNVVIVGNTIQASGNAGLQVTQDYARTTALVFSRNWADGGDCSVKLHHKGGSSLGPVDMTGNRFGRNTKYAGCAILRTSVTSIDGSGNVWDDNGQAVVVKVDG